MARSGVSRAGWRFLEDGPIVTARMRRAFGLSSTLRNRVDDFWFESDFAPGWRAAYRLVPYGGQPVIAEVRVFPADQYDGRRAGTWRAEVLGVRSGGAVTLKEDGVLCPPVGRGITARLLRRVPFGEERRHAAEFLRKLPPGAPFDEMKAKMARPRTSPAARRGRPDEFYAGLARAYVERCAAGSRRPVADLEGSYRMEVTAIRDAIHEARARGLLTSGRRGSPGGQLTAAAIALLGGRKRRARR